MVLVTFYDHYACGSIRWLYYRDVTGICFTITALFLLLILLLLSAEETAMFANRQIVCDRCTLLSYRHSAGVLKSTFIDKLEQHGLLRYRGSRGGRATRTRRVISKLGQTVSIVEIPRSYTDYDWSSSSDHCSSTTTL